MSKNDKSDYWPCGCVKRRNGVMTHIRLNSPKLSKCRVCGCKRDDVERLRQREAPK